MAEGSIIWQKTKNPSYKHAIVAYDGAKVDIPSQIAYGAVVKNLTRPYDMGRHGRHLTTLEQSCTYHFEFVHSSWEDSPWRIHIIALHKYQQTFKAENKKAELLWNTFDNCNILHTIWSSMRLWLSTSSCISPDSCCKQTH